MEKIVIFMKIFSKHIPFNVIKDLNLHNIIRSIRDWGRDCICPPGRDNFCGRRFSQQHGDLKFGYDHKYVYSYFGLI